jgi:hypothetical protein
MDKEDQVPEPKKEEPKVDDKSNIRVDSKIKIFDPETDTIFVQGRA